MLAIRATPEPFSCFLKGCCARFVSRINKNAYNTSTENVSASSVAAEKDSFILTNETPLERYLSNTIGLMLS